MRVNSNYLETTATGSRRRARGVNVVLYFKESIILLMPITVGDTISNIQYTVGNTTVEYLKHNFILVISTRWPPLIVTEQH